MGVAPSGLHGSADVSAFQLALAKVSCLSRSLHFKLLATDLFHLLCEGWLCVLLLWCAIPGSRQTGLGGWGHLSIKREVEKKTV